MKVVYVRSCGCSQDISLSEIGQSRHANVNCIARASPKSCYVSHRDLYRSGTPTITIKASATALYLCWLHNLAYSTLASLGRTIFDIHLEMTIGSGAAEATNGKSLYPAGFRDRHQPTPRYCRRCNVRGDGAASKNSDTLLDGTGIPLSTLQAATLPGSYAATGLSAWH